MNDIIIDVKKKAAPPSDEIKESVSVAPQGYDPYNDPAFQATISAQDVNMQVRTLSGFHGIFVDIPRIPLYRDRGYVFPVPGEPNAVILDEGVYAEMIVNGKKYFGNGTDVIAVISQAQYDAMLAESAAALERSIKGELAMGGGTLTETKLNVSANREKGE